MSSYRTGYEQIGICEKLLPNFVIYTRPYKIPEYLYGVSSYYIKLDKIYVYIKVQYANYEGNHFTNLNLCILKHKVEIDACINKTFD